MKQFLTLCALAGLVGGSSMNSLPAGAKDAAADVAKDQAKAASETNKANEQVAKGHSFRAGRAAKKAEKDQQKEMKDENKAAQGK